MSGDKVKIIYFNFRGRAELARLILAQAGVDYDDVRYTFEQWPEVKKTGVSPTGQLPAMEYRGETIGQSMSIARFLARENGLYGKTSWEGAKADMVVDCIMDLLTKCYEIKYNEKDEERKKERGEVFVKETLVAFLENLGKVLEKNGGQFFAGKELTYADLAMADCLFTIEVYFGTEWKSQAPKLIQFQERIFALPNIKKWIETRPKTDG